MVEVEVVSPIEVSAEVQKYTLVSDDIYVRRYDSATVPDWYKSLIESIIASNVGITDIQSAIGFLTLQGNGYAQSIVELHTADSSTNATLETLTSQVGANTAGIGTLNVTKVDSTAAQAIATNVIGSAFGEGGAANSWFTSKISTYASNTQANTNSITTLNSTLNGQSVRIDTVESVNMAQASSISQLTTDTAVAIAGLQNQIDGSVSTWFYATSPEYSAADTTTALLSTSTDTLTQLVTNALVFDTVHSQMYKYIGAYVANYNLTTAVFSNTALWTPVYKMVLPEASWLATDAGASPVRHSLSIDSGTELVTNALVYHVQTDQIYKFLPLVAENNVNLTLETWTDSLRWGPIAHTKVTTQRTNHIGDLYYDNLTGFAYRYIHSDIQDNPDLGLIFSWIQIVDSDTVTALANAATAQNTADGKRTVFYSSTTPIDQVINGTLIPLEEGDLWVNATTKVTKIYAKTSTLPDVFQWVDITNTATQNALIGLGILEETNDGVVYTYYSTTAPTLITHPTMSYGDWWVDTDAVPIIAYRYQDSNGKNVGVLSWVNESTSILGKSMIESDTAKKEIAKVVDGTLAINITSATVNGTAIVAYVAGEIDKEVVILSGTATPTISPTTPTGKLNDIYIQKTTATGTSGVVVDVVNTWKHNGTIWEVIGNNNNLTALADLADGKRTIYSNVSGSVPTGEINDIWMPTTGTNDATWIPGEVYRYNGTAWVIATRYSASIAALKNTLQSQLDGKVDTYYQDTIPSIAVGEELLHVGDYWYVTATNGSYIKGNVYKYTNTAGVFTWEYTADVTKSAFDAIDGKKTIFGGATVPTAIAVNDVWIPNGYIGTTYTNGFMYQWNGTIWAANVTYTDDTVANAKSIILYQDTEPTVLTHPLLDNGDQWVNTTTKELKIWDGNNWGVTTNDTANKAYTIANAEKRLYNAPLGLPTPPVPVSPIVLGSGDLWVVTDRWYTTATAMTSGVEISTFGNLVKRYDAITATWSDITNTEAKSSALKWTAKSSKYITAPDGSITGFEMSDGSATNSAFTITADQFKLVASGQNVASKNPMSVDATTGEITFNGIVDFTNTNLVNGYAGTTTIDGGMITTGTVSAETLNADAINGKNISGVSITGAYIFGSVIKSSWIDYSSTGSLTNWISMIYTDPLVTTYNANFAKNPDGTLVITNTDKVRLQGFMNNYATPSSTNTSIYVPGDNISRNYPINKNDGICPYDSYAQSSPKRCINLRPNAHIEGDKVLTEIAFSFAYIFDYTLNITVFGEVLMFRIRSDSYTTANNFIMVNGVVKVTGKTGISYIHTSGSGLRFKIEWLIHTPSSGWATYKITLLNFTTSTITRDFSSTNKVGAIALDSVDIIAFPSNLTLGHTTNIPYYEVSN